MRQVKYQLDGAYVKQLRLNEAPEGAESRRELLEQRLHSPTKTANAPKPPKHPTLKWTQEQLAAYAGVSVRIIIAIENNKRGVSKWIATRVANTLGVSLKSLTAKFDGGADFSWQEIPDLEPHLRKRLLEAMELDMTGDHMPAAAICEEILGLLPSDNFDHWGFVTIKLATFLDHAKENQRAIQRLDDLLVRSRHHHEVSPEVLLWAHYHLAISYRRLGDFTRAEQKLQPVLDCRETRFQMAAGHQLGILYLKRAMLGEPNLYAAARDLFERSLEYWRQKNDHRAAFSLRRLGQLAAVQGHLPKAIDAFLEATAICAANECKRYVKIIREDLERFVYVKLPPARADAGQVTSAADLIPAVAPGVGVPIIPKRPGRRHRELACPGNV